MLHANKRLEIYREIRTNNPAATRQEIRELFYAECTVAVLRSLADEECDRIERNWELQEVSGKPQLVATPSHSRNIVTLQTKRAAREQQKAAETAAYERLVEQHKPISIYDLVMQNGKPARLCSAGYLRRTGHALIAACVGLADHEILGEKRTREEVERAMVAA